MQRMIKGALGLLFPADVRCVCCGSESEEIVPQSGLCTRCMGQLPHDRRTETVMDVPCCWALRYEGTVREMIHGFKFENRRYLARTLGYLMVQAYAEQLARLPFDGICAVPLHRNRLKKRGYNQSLLLAEEVSRHTGIPVYPGALSRLRDTRPQMELARAERLVNVRGAFACTMDLSAKRVLLVDDILTTGASVAGCAEAIRKAGGSAVVLCAARREAGSGK